MSDHELIYQALRFYFWAAGEGICPVHSDAALEPEEGFWQYGLRTGDHDWETVAQRYRDSDAGQQLQRGERPQWGEGETWAETITKLRAIKSDDEIEAEMAISRAGIERWASGAGKPRPSTQAALRRMIYEWLAEGGLVTAVSQALSPSLESPQP